MKYLKKKTALAVALTLVAVALGVVAWMLVPSSEDGMLRSVAIVEQATWQEISVDGKPQLYFSASAGDTALLGVTANRDSALHRRRVAGCWINRWMLVPSCSGRLLTIALATPPAPRLKDDSTIVALCRQSVAVQLKTLKAQKSELDYYLRVHGVQDNGYQTIAALAARVALAYGDVSRAGHMLDSLVRGGQHRLGISSRTAYTALLRDASGKLTRVPLTVVDYGRSRKTMVLQTSGGNTPDGASALAFTPWRMQPRRGVIAVGYPGLGEPGLECDTVSPIVVPGNLGTGGVHDLPRLLVPDGSPVFTRKGRFVGIVHGNSVLREPIFP